MPETEARPPAQNRHGGAPRGERPALRARPRVFRRAPERLSALRPPLDWVSEAKRQSPDAAMRARERDGLFDIVRFANDAQSLLPGRLREGGDPMITGRCSWVPALRPLCGRRPGRPGWREGPTCGCGKRCPGGSPCFRPVLYRELRYCNVCRLQSSSRTVPLGLR
jgi:hypothetical protein